MTRILAISILFFISSQTTALRPTPVQPANPARISPCSAFKSAAVVFIGEAISTEATATGGKRKSRFSMGEWLTSQTSLPSQLTVAMDTGACGIAVEPGATYLIFAIKEADGTYSTSACAGTKKIDRAGDDIEMIQGLVDGHPEGRIFGDVIVSAGTPSPTSAAEPLKGAIVTAAGPGGPFQVTTEEDGRFHFPKLLDGDYVVTAELPTPYDKLNGPSDARHVTVKLPDNCGTEIHFIAQSPAKTE